VTARKFVDLKAATAHDGELMSPAAIETVPRALQAPELATLPRVAGIDPVAARGSLYAQ
jgi:hypothetical protein